MQVYTDTRLLPIQDTTTQTHPILKYSIIVKLQIYNLVDLGL